MSQRGVLLALLALLPGLVVCAQASAQETTDYTVQEGDTCGNIARRHFGHSRSYNLIHQANPDLGPMPHHLEPGTVLRLPPSTNTSSAEATVTATRREVRHQPRGGDWDRSRVGQHLETGWHVSTGEESAAELTFRRSSVAQVRADTLVIIYGGEVRRVRREGSRAVVRRGAMLSRLSSLSGTEPMEVETPSALARLGAGETLVDVDDSGDTRVSVQSGEPATVTTPTGEGAVRVRAGNGTRIAPGERPRRPRPLPRAPRFVDGPRVFVGLTGHGGSAYGEWSPAPNAHRYRVEIARRSDGRELLVSAEVDASVRRFAFHRLPPGTYYARVGTVDEERFEGGPGRPMEITVVGAELISPGATEPVGAAVSDDPFGLDELDDGLAEADIERADGRPPVVPQHSGLRLPAGVRCRVGTADPVSELRLTELGPVELTCAGEEGEAVGGVAFQVVPTEAVLLSEDGQPLSEVGRGTSTMVRLRFEPGFDDVRGLTLATPAEVSFADLAPHPEGGFAARLTTTDDAADQIVLGVTTADESHLPLAEVSAAVPRFAPEPEPPRAVEQAGTPQPRAVQEAFGLGVFPGSVGLRDERRAGSGMHLAVGVLSATGARQEDPRVRVTAGARVALLEDYLRLDVAVPLDAYGEAGSPQRASRDLYLAASSRILDDDDTGIGLAAEVGVLAPTAVDQGVQDARLQVAVDFSIRFLEDERLTIRTRQAAIFGLEGDAILWASAYGLDVWIVGPLSLGVEVDLVIGDEVLPARPADPRAVQSFAAVGMGGGMMLDFDPITISLAGRGSLGDAAILSDGAVSLAVRGTYDLGQL